MVCFKPALIPVPFRPGELVEPVAAAESSGRASRIPFAHPWLKAALVLDIRKDASDPRFRHTGFTPFVGGGGRRCAAPSSDRTWGSMFAGKTRMERGVLVMPRRLGAA
jgi:hypothetical protein